MMAKTLTKADQVFIAKSVQRYIANKDIFEALGEALFRTLTTSQALAPLIHSIKYRVKSPGHLEEKLGRKISERGRRAWGINNSNLFQKVNDLVGLRILHLHTSQIEEIDRQLRACLSAEKYEKLDGPIAKTWDLEYKNYSLRLASRLRKVQVSTRACITFSAQETISDRPLKFK